MNASRSFNNVCIGNHTVYLVQSGTNLHQRAPQKAEIARAVSASAISDP